MPEEAKSVEDILQMLDDQATRASAHAEQMQHLAERISEVTAEVSSPHDEVRVRVDSSGRVIGVTLTEAAMELSPDGLGRMLLTVIGDGYRQVSGQTVDLAREELGDQSPTVAQMRTNAVKNAPRFEEMGDSDDR